MTAQFDGFPQEGLDFLHTLGTQDKAWFDANKNVYKDAVVAPTKAFVSAMGEALAGSFAAQIVAQPKANGSISPINNDLRFSPDKAPYKDHLLLKFWEGDNKKTAPTLYVRLSRDELGFASGAMLPDLDRWRALIDDDKTGAPLAAVLDKLGKGRKIDMAGEGYKRVPKPFSADHPRAALLRHKWFQARWAEPAPKSIHKAAFVDHCLTRLEALSEIHRWLVQHL